MNSAVARLAGLGVSAAAVLLVTNAGGDAGAHPQHAGDVPAWSGFAADAQHTAEATVAPQPLNRVRWRAPVDLHPVREPPDGTFAHYASPMITSTNTVIVPTRIGQRRGFELIAYAGRGGREKWRLSTDYTVPPGQSRKFPGPLPASLVDDHRVAVAAAGGTVVERSRVDQARGAVRRVAFYGIGRWKAHRLRYRRDLHITTPLTTGPDGSLYFGFSVVRSLPGDLRSGVARISPSGQGSWVSARALALRPAPSRVAFNCAPAISFHDRIGYIALLSGRVPMLVGFDTASLKPEYRRVLRDPQTRRLAKISPESSATPAVGPDGDVFFGVLGNPDRRHDDRGWLLHFTARLRRARVPGSFGWDQTVSVVPSTAVNSYHGRSSYLLVSKYNDYRVGPHGTGRTKLALLDPHAGQRDRFSNVRVMHEVRTVLSPRHPPKTPTGTRYEWCINSIAVDPTGGVAIANNEDGHLYRWNLTTGKLTDAIRLNRPRGQAYTPTLIGPDGTSYAIENGTLYAVGG